MFVVPLFTTAIVPKSMVLVPALYAAGAGSAACWAAVILAPVGRRTVCVSCVAACGPSLVKVAVNVPDDKPAPSVMGPLRAVVTSATGPTTGMVYVAGWFEAMPALFTAKNRKVALPENAGAGSKLRVAASAAVSAWLATTGSGPTYRMPLAAGGRLPTM